MTARVARRAWLVWGVATVAYTVAVVGRSSLAATGATAAERFGVSSGLLSLLAVLQLAVYAALQIPAGILVDRFGPRRLIAGGAVLVAVGQLVLATTSVFALAVAGRVLVGAGDAVTFVSILRLVPAWFPARRVPVLNQLAGILGQLGQVVSAVPLAGLVASAGWTPAYLAASGTTVLTAALAVAVLRDRPAGAPAPEVDPVDDGGAGGFAGVLRAPSTRLGFWCHFTAPFPANTFGLLWGFPFLTAGEGVSPGSASGLIAVVVVAGIVVGPLFGLLAGRAPRRRVELVVAAAVLQLVAWTVVLAWPGAAPLPVLAMLAVIVGLGGPASLVAFDVARAGVGADHVGRASGVTNTGGFVSTIAVVLLVGLVLDLQGAGSPALWSPDAFRTAMLVQFPVWLIGFVGIALARRRAGGPARRGARR